MVERSAYIRMVGGSIPSARTRKEKSKSFGSPRGRPVEIKGDIENNLMNIKYLDLSKDEKELIDAAERVLANAYNPYGSQTKVGASARISSGEIVIGSSMANASSTVNLCAERVALAAANSIGHRDIIAMAIIGTDSDGVIENPIMPCGVCRQFMEEFLIINNKDIPIICSNSSKDIIIRTSFKELLPLPYEGNRQ